MSSSDYDLNGINKEINDDDKDLKRNPSSNQNLTRFVPVSVTILVLYFHFQCLLWAAADLWFYSQFLLLDFLLSSIAQAPSYASPVR